jgi:hypothetical protein
MVMGNYKAIALFILVGYLVYCFNKNMTVVLLTALVLTSIFMAGGIMREGNQNMKDGDKSTDGETTKTTPTDSTAAKPESKDKKTPQKPAAKPETKKGETVVSDGTEQDIKTEGEVGEPEGHATDNAESGMTTMYKKRNRIDYASTVEDAYGDLNKLLGSDGIKRLTDDTQKLMGQQMQLAEAMKSMTPLLSQAKSLIAGFDTKQFGDITAMAKQFGVAN